MINFDKINTELPYTAFKGEYFFLSKEDFKKLCIKLRLNENNLNIINLANTTFIKFNGDLSDLGNTIGINIGHYINENDLGFEKNDFISGITHGISIIDGTHHK